MLPFLLTLALLNPQIEEVGSNHVQIVTPDDRRFYVVVWPRLWTVHWCYHETEDATFGNEHYDTSIIAHGYWPNCNFAEFSRRLNPAPYCGCKQSKVVEHY